MQHHHPPGAEVEGWLKAVGIESICQWDVLVFLYRHQTSLVGAEHIVRLLGYTTERVVAALDVLESLRFVARSRASQNVRLYQFTVPPEPPRGEAFERLRDLAGRRAGRVFLAGHLRRSDQAPQEGLAAARRVQGVAPPAARAARQRSRQRGGGRETWRKAI